MSVFGGKIRLIVDKISDLHRGDPVLVAADGIAPMRLATTCTYISPDSRSGQYDVPENCPGDLREFWSLIQSARLYEDVQYGQWGLVLYSPRESINKTRLAHNDRSGITSTDLVVGEFLGDSDLLIVDTSLTSDAYGSTLVSPAIEARSAWPVVAISFIRFLERYIESSGEKYWEL